MYVCKKKVTHRKHKVTHRKKKGKHKPEFNNKNNLFKIDENRLNIITVMQII